MTPTVSPLLVQVLHECASASLLTLYHDVTTVCAVVSQIAIDVEHHRHHSFFGFVCLVQVSTPSADYVIGEHMRCFTSGMTHPDSEWVSVRRGGGGGWTLCF